MQQVGRSYSAVSGYRYGFNGKEKSPEITSDDYDFEARIYDGRIGRWLSVDALAKKYPGWSPYVFSMDNPIRLYDKDGNETGDPIKDAIDKGKESAMFVKLMTAAGVTDDNYSKLIKISPTNETKMNNDTGEIEIFLVINGKAKEKNATNIAFELTNRSNLELMKRNKQENDEGIKDPTQATEYKLGLEAKAASNKLLVATELKLKPDDIIGPNFKAGLEKFQKDVETFGVEIALKNVEDEFMKNMKTVTIPTGPDAGKTGYEKYKAEFEETYNTKKKKPAARPAQKKTGSKKNKGKT